MTWQRSPLLVGVVSVLLHLAGTGMYVRDMKAPSDILMAVGEDHSQFPIYSKVKARLGPWGYDGQFYYAIAHAPFAEYGPEVDIPGGRQLRILFPLLGYAASFGNAAWLPVAMPLVNLMMLGLLAFLGAKWALHHDLSPWYGLTLPFVVNALMPTLRNLTDTTAMAMVFWLMYSAMRGHRPWWVGLAALAAVFAREQNAAVLALVIGHALWQRRWGTALAVCLAGAAWVWWVWWLTRQYGSPPFLPGAGNFAPPFEGLRVAWAEALHHWTAYSPQSMVQVYSTGAGVALGFVTAVIVINKQERERRWKAIVGALVLFVVVLKISPVPYKAFGVIAVAYHVGLMAAWAAFGVRFRRDEMLPLGMATGGVLLMAVCGPLIYVDYWAYGRAFFWLPMGVWILAVQTRRKTALQWAGLAVYFPVCKILHQ